MLEFLTEVGHHSDPRRQEWVPFADVLGVSTLVEDLAAPRPHDPAIGRDALFCVKPALLGEFRPEPGAAGRWTLAVDLVLARLGETGRAAGND